ncbi:MAG: hypothetical protein RR965_07490, partial [Enterococcus sp.]
MEFETNNGHLIWAGCDTVALAKEFGTPLYVFSQTQIEEKYGDWVHNFGHDNDFERCCHRRDFA